MRCQSLTFRLQHLVCSDGRCATLSVAPGADRSSCRGLRGMAAGARAGVINLHWAKASFKRVSAHGLARVHCGPRQRDQIVASHCRLPAVPLAVRVLLPSGYGHLRCWRLHHDRLLVEPPGSRECSQTTLPLKFATVEVMECAGTGRGDSSGDVWGLMYEWPETVVFEVRATSDHCLTVCQCSPCQ